MSPVIRHRASADIDFRPVSPVEINGTLTAVQIARLLVGSFNQLVRAVVQLQVLVSALIDRIERLERRR